MHYLSIYSQVFTLQAGKEERTLAAGLKRPITIRFTPKEKPSTYRGDLDVFADDEVVLTVPVVW